MRLPSWNNDSLLPLECRVPFAANTTYRPKPNAGDFLFWVRCSDILCTPPAFDVVDFWEFKEGDRLLITNREEDYPAPVEDMDESTSDCLWRLLPGDRLSWVGHRILGGEPKRVLFAVVDCEEYGYAYGAPADPTYEAILRFGEVLTEMTPATRALFELGLRAVTRLGTPRTWASPED